VAYEVQHPAWQVDSYSQELVVENLKTGMRVPVPLLEGVPSNPEWSPDGHWLAFVEHPKQGVGQIWDMEAKRICRYFMRKSSLCRDRLDNPAFGEYHRRDASQRIVYLSNRVRIAHKIEHFFLAPFCFDRCSIRDVLRGLPLTTELTDNLDFD